MTVNRLAMSVAIIALVFLGGLFFGDPQWNKYVYMFQVYTLRRYAPTNLIISNIDPVSSNLPELKPSKDYSGYWNEWYENGMKSGTSYFEDGALLECVTWHESGSIASKWIQYDDDMFTFSYSANGELENIVMNYNYVLFSREDNVDRRSSFDLPSENDWKHVN